MAYEEVDLDECKARLTDISSEIDALKRTIEEINRDLFTARDYTFKKNLRGDKDKAYAKINSLRLEYRKTLDELKNLRTKINKQRGR